MNLITLQNREFEEAKQHNKRNQIISTLFLLIALIAIPFFMADGSEGDLLAFENRTLQIHTPGNQSYCIPYNQILSMELIENPDFGVCLSGDNTKKLCYGVWENAALGEYVLCTYKSPDVVIQINTPNQVYWIGYESGETTRILYQSFLEHLAQ